MVVCVFPSSLQSKKLLRYIVETADVKHSTFDTLV